MTAPLALLTGYASLTETPYQVGNYVETIKRNAFRRTLSENPDVQLLLNRQGLPLARTKAGTLRLSEDDRGLKVDAQLDDERTDVQGLLRAMSAAAIDQMSFAFQCTDGDWNKDFSGRTIKSVSIHRGDVSVCNFGASEATHAALVGDDLNSRRSMAELIGNNVRGSVSFGLESVQHSGGLTEIRMVQTRAPITSKLTRCQRCGGSGKVDLGSGHISCPNCKGKGRTGSPPRLQDGSAFANNDGPHSGSASDGSSRARSTEDMMAEWRAKKAAAGKCDLCGGSGTIRKGKRTCPQCDGTGNAPPQDAPAPNNDEQNSLRFPHAGASRHMDGLAILLAGSRRQRERAFGKLEKR